MWEGGKDYSVAREENRGDQKGLQEEHELIAAKVL